MKKSHQNVDFKEKSFSQQVVEKYDNFSDKFNFSPYQKQIFPAFVLGFAVITLFSMIGIYALSGGIYQAKAATCLTGYTQVGAECLNEKGKSLRNNGYKGAIGDAETNCYEIGKTQPHGCDEYGETKLICDSLDVYATNADPYANKTLICD